MSKSEFLRLLRKELEGLGEEAVQEYIDYYSEMIDDRIEEGLSEEEAVAAMGNPSEIAKQIIADTPIPKILKSKLQKTHTLKAWHIVLIVLGSPIWFSLLVALISVIFSMFVTLVSLLFSFYAASIGIGAGAIGGIFSIIPLFIGGNTYGGVMMLGLSFICAGLAILFFLLANAVTKLIFKLCKKLIIWIKSRLLRKEETK